MGGGGGSYDGLTIQHLTTTPINENGSYVTTTGGQSITITGTGVRDGDNNGSNCQAQCQVWADDSLQVTTLEY
jgi:hypothetical protein